jgi:hypothetical protein
MKVLAWETDQMDSPAGLVTSTPNLSPSKATDVVEEHLTGVRLISAHFAGEPQVYERATGITATYQADVQYYGLYVHKGADAVDVCIRHGIWRKRSGSIQEVRSALRCRSLFLAPPASARVLRLLSPLEDAGCERIDKREGRAPEWQTFRFYLETTHGALDRWYFGTEMNHVFEDTFSALADFWGRIGGHELRVPDAGSFRVSYRASMLPGE